MPKYLLITLLLTLIIGGPARAEDELTYSGFLGDYSLLKSYPHEPGVLTATNPAKSLGDYKKVMLSSVQLIYAPDSGSAPLTDWQVKELEEYLRQKTRQFLSTQFDVVREPAPDVLLFRLGVTDIIAHEFNAPVVWDPKKPGMDIAHATIEADFVVSTTGERVFAIVDERASLRYQDILQTYTWWNTEELYVRWSEVFSSIVAEHYGRY